MTVRTAKFQIGQIVRHRFHPFRGVIYDVDPTFSNTEEWWLAIPEEMRPRKAQPFYHLFAETDQTSYIAYVSEQKVVRDDDPAPELWAVGIEVEEGAGLAVVTLELSAPTSFEVVANYATVDGTAMAPEDYETVIGPATIPPLDTMTTVEIPIVNDWIEESPEFFTLELSGVVNAVLATPSVEVTIFDDDAGILFGDGFESGDTARWSATTP